MQFFLKRLIILGLWQIQDPLVDALFLGFRFLLERILEFLGRIHAYGLRLDTSGMVMRRKQE